ncbi:MAG: hypothetical protein C4K58_01545 [Flavobacteriaceae bacterium]|nr:MAG: hypothetical protein C4K58_01545 [Flavobacteriaceae bacterium]
MLNPTEYRKSNALILILYFFQYGFLLPFTILFRGQYAIVAFTSLLLGYCFLTKRISITPKLVVIIILPLMLLLLKLPFEEYDKSGYSVALELLQSYISIGISAIIIGSIKFSYPDFLLYGYKLAWINFLLICFLPLTPIYGDEINYMRFGYSLLPTVFFSFAYIFDKKRRKSAWILFALSFIELFVFGARGATLTLLIFMFFYIFIVSRIKPSTKFFILICIVTLFLNIKSIILFTITTLARYGYSSYALTKYANLVLGNSLASTSSGRDKIYETAISRFKESPILGSPLNVSMIDTGASYYHNIFLDIVVSFGIFGLFFFVFFLIKNIFKALRSSDNNFKIIFLIFFVTSMGRLIVSSSFWLRPEFWIFISFCLHNNGITTNVKKIKR